MDRLPGPNMSLEGTPLAEERARVFPDDVLGVSGVFDALFAWKDLVSGDDSRAPLLAGSNSVCCQN